jgi:hypothetical protein
MANHPSIFISYRIADSLTQAGLLHQSLEAEFGKGTVFYDKNNLKPGMKWDDELADKVRRAAVVLVLIAKKKDWLGVDDNGIRRIDDPNDWVRREIEAALGDSQKLVVPVLFNNAQLPEEGVLPETLRPLLKYQMIQIWKKNWDNDLRPLLETLQEHLNYDPTRAGNAGQNPNDPQIHPEFHAYTCDRELQYDHFDDLRADIRPGSVRFFYLHGDERHAHKSFFKRITLDLQGKYLNLPDAMPDAGKVERETPPKKKTVVAVDFLVDSAGASSPERLRECFVRDLYTALNLDPKEYHPLVKQNLQNLLLESPKTRALRAGDHLCVFARINHWYWNPRFTPDAARWFVQTFCPTQLSRNSPAVLFFFAFDFNEEENPGVCQEVREAIKPEAEHVVALPELGMVEQAHIQRWFVRYERYFSPPVRRQIIAEYFTDTRYFMEDLEPKLKKLINDYFNKKEA